jgi:hypothetical protein
MANVLLVGFDWSKGHKGALTPWFSVPQSIGVLVALPDPHRNDADFLFSSKKDHHVKSMTYVLITLKSLVS